MKETARLPKYGMIACAILSTVFIRLTLGAFAWEKESSDRDLPARLTDGQIIALIEAGETGRLARMFDLNRDIARSYKSLNEALLSLAGYISFSTGMLFLILANVFYKFRKGSSRESAEKAMKPGTG